MAAQDPDHSGEVYPIIISIPAQHDSAEAWMWSCLCVAQADMSEYVIQYFNIASIDFCISSHCELQGVNRFCHHIF